LRYGASWLAADPILAKMRASEWDARNGIITSLAEVRIGYPVFVQALADYLDNSAESRQVAARALWQLGPAAKPAEAALRRLADKQIVPNSADAAAQFYARKALENLTSPRTDRP
jgi:hypothetical protein